MLDEDLRVTGSFGWGLGSRGLLTYPERARARGSPEARDKGDVCVLPKLLTVSPSYSILGYEIEYSYDH